MAGLAETCSHIGTLLHWVETAVQMRDVTTCTSVENKLIAPAPVMNIPYLMLHEIDFSTPKPSEYVDLDPHSIQCTSASNPVAARTNGENDACSISQTNVVMSLGC